MWGASDDAQKKLRQMARRNLVVFEDERGSTEHPRVSRVWARGAEPFRVPTASNHRQRLNVFGWVATLEGRNGLTGAPRGDTQGFLVLLGRVRRRWRRVVLHSFMDRACWYRGRQIKQYVAPRRQIHPGYRPGLNSQERTWRQLRYERTNNDWFAGLDQAWRGIRETPRRCSAEKIRHLCNISY